MIVEKVLAETDWAYMAGIVDGEGSIVIHKTRPQKKYQDKTHRYVVDVKIGMTDKRAMYWIKDNFGGCLYTSRKASKSSREMFGWQIRANKACDFLKRLSPYLKTKALQAELSITFQSTLIRKTGWKGDGIQPEELAKRDAFYEMNKMLNHGYDPETEGGYYDR